MRGSVLESPITLGNPAAFTAIETALTSLRGLAAPHTSHFASVASPTVCTLLATLDSSVARFASLERISRDTLSIASLEFVHPSVISAKLDLPFHFHFLETIVPAMNL